MVNAREAVRKANAFVADLFPEGRDLRLEQVAPHGPDWEVVFSFHIADPNTIMAALGQPNRVFKAVEVDRESGEPLSVKVWKF